MGYRVEKYDLSELARISQRGMVVPSLFWILPVGDWTPHDVDSLWHEFTAGVGNCRRYGLLLVRDNQSRSIPGNERIDLEQVSARLRDILPAGARNRYARGIERHGSRYVLFFSGAYPQPGWGLLIQIGHPASARVRVEQLVSSAISALGPRLEVQSDLRTLESAAERHYASVRLESERPTIGDYHQFEKECTQARHFVETANNLLSLISQRESSAIRAASQQLKSLEPVWATFGGLSPSVEDLVRQRRILFYANTLLSTPDDVLQRDVLPIHMAVSSDIARKEEILKNRGGRSRQSIEALIALEAIVGRIDASRDVRAFANQLLDDAIASTVAIVPSARDAALSVLSELESSVGRQVANRQRDYDVWQEKYTRAHREFAVSLEAAAEIQWRLGPRFLVALEDAAKNQGVAPTTVAWDAPRMVGWKLLLRDIEITLRDVRSVASKLSVHPPEPTAHQDADLDRPIDGSYFTDYVHFIAMSALDRSPRSISVELVASLLRPTELRSLIAQYGGRCLDTDSRHELGDALLNALGWAASPMAPPRPLIGYAEAFERDYAGPAHFRDPINLRKSLESFCKDVLRILAYKLGNSPQRIWHAIDGCSPAYVPASQIKDWNDEVARCTSGAAAILIERLGDALPDIAAECKEIASDVRRLAGAVNPLAHDKELTPEDAVMESLGSRVRAIVHKASELFGELPWHFTPTMMFGDSPRVLSGSAWSHAVVAPRLLRVISMTQLDEPTELLVWNHRRTNPVIADPVFLGLIGVRRQTDRN